MNSTEKVKRLYYKVWENLNCLHAMDDEKIAHIAEVLLDDIDKLVKAIEQREWALVQKALSKPGIAGLCYTKGAEPADWGVWTCNGEPEYWGKSPKEAIMAAAKARTRGEVT